MDENKRRFIKLIGAFGLGVSFPLFRTIAAENGAAKKTAKTAFTPAATQLALIIDIEKCLDSAVRDACVAACRREHNLPVDTGNQERNFRWIWTDDFAGAFPDQCHEHFSETLKKQPVLVLCNHCSSPACTKVCPVKATWKRPEDGIVMMDMHRCIGCRYCMAACPYGARSFNWFYPRPDIKGASNPGYPTRTKGVVEKCTFCAERIGIGREPACVEAVKGVPGGEGALIFGNLSDPQSEVSRILRERRSICRQIRLGTRPNVYYLV
jgi:molybdopterin-containing oxidoreductase family iron-sulfur binding subunit